MDARRAIVEALSRLEGVAVQCVIPDLETAASVLARYTPDILVTGTELADGEGIELVEKVRRRGMSIVVVGSAASREVWLRYLAAGADRFVESDRDLEELQDVVRDLVRRLGAARTERISMLLGHLHGDDRSRRGSLDFGTIVLSAMAFAQRLIVSRLDVVIEIEGALPRLSGVASDLERLVLDLVLSASETVLDGGGVHVVVTRALDAVMLAVTSSGADLCGSRKGSDLAMARTIVDRHRGTLLVATCEPASSSVLVMLPIADDSARRPAEPSPPC